MENQIMRYLFLIIAFIGLNALVWGQDSTVVNITGLGEIRFDRRLQDSQKWLEKEIIFDTTCQHLSKVYSSKARPCLQTFVIHKHISNITWETAYAVYFNDTLLEINVEGASQKFVSAFEAKYGSPKSIDKKKFIISGCKDMSSIYSKIWHFEKSDAHIMHTFSCVSNGVTVKLHWRNLNSSKIANCEKDTIQKMKKRCAPTDLNKF